MPVASSTSSMTWSLVRRQGERNLNIVVRAMLSARTLASFTVSQTDSRHRVGSFELAAAARRLRGIDEETKPIDGCVIYATIKEGPHAPI